MVKAQVCMLKEHSEMSRLAMPSAHVSLKENYTESSALNAESLSHLLQCKWDYIAQNCNQGTCLCSLWLQAGYVGLVRISAKYQYITPEIIIQL